MELLNLFFFSIFWFYSKSECRNHHEIAIIVAEDELFKFPTRTVEIRFSSSIVWLVPNVLIWRVIWVRELILSFKSSFKTSQWICTFNLLSLIKGTAKKRTFEIWCCFRLKWRGWGRGVISWSIDWWNATWCSNPTDSEELQIILLHLFCSFSAT